MDVRLQVDKNVSKSFTPFTKFTANESEIRDIHRSFAPDLSLADLAVQFQELQQCNELPKSNPHTVRQNIVKADNEQYYQNVSVMLGWILVCKPYSANCETVISLYNKVKLIFRSSLKHQMMSDYLYINMPPQCSFDLSPATFQWMLQKQESKMRKVKKELKRSQEGEILNAFEYFSVNVFSKCNWSDFNNPNYEFFQSNIRQIWSI